MDTIGNKQIYNFANSKSNNTNNNNNNHQQPDLSSYEVDKIKFEERFAYRIEHFAAITQLILLDSSYLGNIEHNLERYFFASSDKLGSVKIWDLDAKDSIVTLNFMEDAYN